MRSVYVATSCGCSLPQRPAIDLMKRSPTRRPPVSTEVGRYVEAHSASLAKRLRKVLNVWARKAATHVRSLGKAESDTDRIKRIIAAFDSEDMGVDLTDALSPAMLDAFRRAASRGMTQVGMVETEDITKQLDVAAKTYAADRGGELIKDFADTTEDALRGLLERAVEEGMSADDLSDAVMDLGAFGEVRADMIARTELAFAHVQGNVEGWRESDEVEGKQAILGDNHGIDDECDECADAGVVGLDDEFIEGFSFPPFHPNCCVGDTLVSAVGISAHYKRWFEGEVVEVRTTHNCLTVTPNHPILTRRGWILAGLLDRSDYVFECSDPASAVLMMDPNDHCVPARIDQIAESLLMAGGSATSAMPITAETFHGDGMVDGEVDVVWTAGAFPSNVGIEILERSKNETFSASQNGRVAFSTERNFAPFGKRNGSAPHSCISGLSLKLPLLGGFLRGVEPLHGTEVPDRQPVTMEKVSQSGTVTVESLCQGDSRLACLIQCVKLVDVRKRYFSGHVFNLSTQDEWYFANAILTHNCVCDLLPVLKAAPELQGDES